MWKNLVEFWESPKGEERSKRNIENRSKSMMCHYASSKSFARIRAEKKKKEGKEPDPLDVLLETHEPKQGSRLDNASATVKKAIQEDLARLPQSSSPCAYEEQRLAIFRKYVGEDKNGYAKNFGLGVKVPRSRTKRCALEEERAKRIEDEEDEEDGENAKEEENAGSECNDENEKDNEDFNDYGGEEHDYHAQNDEDMEFYDYD
ncbi:uncharacterized protein LOC110686458 [Chenopodium quinoa]|uniref:uncharacterized protein LOC110686458 n=1 Tax=Chenopodium quinoa TaxID=63459 RepID=UPI000B798EC0|nr:uncharacterized protein LOC110686458 [Chenopodium quinoa]